MEYSGVGEGDESRAVCGACAPAMDKPSEEIGMSADEKVARGLGFDLRGDILMGPFWVLV